LTQAGPRKILVLRRDNIGDLVCTTPLFESLRDKYPRAAIHALVNSYNRPVLENNPNVDAIHTYTKAKHRGETSATSVYLHRLRLLWHLKQERFDYAILASPGFQPRLLRLAKVVRPAHIVGFVDGVHTKRHAIDVAVPYRPLQGLHETENVFRLLAPLGISGKPPAQKVVPSESACKRAATVDRLTIGVHLSSRKPSQRWPAENFVQLMESIAQRFDVRFLLFWAPGDASNLLHPGDDRKAKRVLADGSSLPVTAVATESLRELIDGLAAADIVVCSDGGAMHIAAGLGKPIVCFFGDSDATRWRPWGVPYELLQTETRNVSDISTLESLNAFVRLLKRTNIARIATSSAVAIN
jgi:heptosyltransferase III